ncbi:MAG: hypothetical protein AAB352_00015 [Patescibacteria group bacterium]
MFSNIKTTNKDKRKSLLFSESGAGNTLIEIIVVIFIIVLFSIILVPDFPKIKRKFALSRSVYKFAQDLKSVQDMGLSGVLTGGAVQAKGYGVFIDLNNTALANKKYIVYADINGDSKYTSQSSSQINHTCGAQNPGEDCVLEVIDFSVMENEVIISDIYNVTGNQQISINFAPPNPNVTITDLVQGSTEVEIIFAVESDSSQTRSVFVNTSGLINVQ